MEVPNDQNCGNEMGYETYFEKETTSRTFLFSGKPVIKFMGDCTQEEYRQHRTLYIKEIRITK